MNNYDLIIVGAGPAGIFTAVELLRHGSKKKILLVEKGKPVEKRHCPKAELGHCVNCRPTCAITTGFSGAGAFSDGKLSLSYEVGGDLPSLIGEEFAQELINYTDKIYLEFGADPHVEGIYTGEDIKEIRKNAIHAGLKLVDCPIRHLGTEEGDSDCSHDVAAESRTCHVQQLAVIISRSHVENIKLRAVCRQTCMYSCRYSGSQVTTYGCSAEQHYIRLVFINNIYEHMCIRLCHICLEFFLVNYDNLIGTVTTETLYNVIRNLIAKDNCCYICIKILCQLCTFADKLVRYACDNIVNLLNKDHYAFIILNIHLCHHFPSNNVLSNQLLYNVVSRFLGIQLNLFALTLESFREGLKHLCRRTLQTEVGLVNRDIFLRPNGNINFVSVEYAAGSHITRIVQLSESCQQARHLNLEHMITIVILSLNDEAVALNLDALCVRDADETEMLSYLRTNLSRIAIDSLTACDDQIVLEILNCCCNCRRCRPCISAAKRTAGEQNSFVSAHSESFAKSEVCLRRSHGYYCNMSAVLVFQTQSSFQTCLIVRVYDRRNAVSYQCFSYRIDLNFVCIRNLLNANYNFH